MNAIIFGSNGQDGYYLRQLLIKLNIKTLCISRSIENKNNFISGSVGDKNFVNSIIKANKPDYIFNFAAESFTNHEKLFVNFETIVLGTLNILEAVKNYSPQTKIFITGSGLQFINHGKPISEQNPFHAGSAYAMARIQSIYAARYYRYLGIRVYVGYLFHHESLYRKPDHISMQTAIKIKGIKEGSKEKITIGDRHVKKEWTHASDIVQAIFLLVNQDDIFECVIGSGKAYSIEDWLRECFNLIGKNWEDYTEAIPHYKPPFQILVSNPQTIQSIGWKQTIDFKKLARIFIYDEE